MRRMILLACVALGMGCADGNHAVEAGGSTAGGDVHDPARVPDDARPDPLPATGEPPPQDRSVEDARATCEREGGRWKQFGNTCVDSCRVARSDEPIACGQALTMGCDCGEARCWTGHTCAPNAPPLGE